MPKYSQEEIEDIFFAKNIRRDGKLFYSELRLALLSVGLDVHNKEIDQYMKQFNKTNDGHLTVEEFTELMNSLFP
ncbi:Caltractin [Hexamita inflata]|uniref:Caltractin n=1 Tax=Hexamita inflata TaxID=28002 RepID=A0AA86R7A7_9EUKA|nr:Caltractin [Hexamita inflata]